MCILCKAGMMRKHFGAGRSFGSRQPLITSRRGFLTGAAAAGAGIAGASLFAARPATAQAGPPPSGTGRPGNRYVIRGGHVMTMDGGEYAQADVVVEGKKIVAVGPGAGAGHGGDVIDASERIVMPGFIDTHHHQFETALRSFLADGVLILDGDLRPRSQRIAGRGRLCLLHIHSPRLRAGLPPAGCLHQRGVRRALPARRWRHHGARRLANPSHAAALRRRRPGAVRYRTPRRIRLFRGRRRERCRRHSRICVSDRRHSPQEQVVFVVRPARPYDHGRGSLSRRREHDCVMDARAPARSSDRRAHPVAVRHCPDPRPARAEPARQPERHRIPRHWPRQPFHPHDRDVRRGLEGGSRPWGASLARRADRDEHAPRHAADSSGCRASACSRH